MTNDEFSVMYGGLFDKGNLIEVIEGLGTNVKTSESGPSCQSLDGEIEKMRK